MFTQSVLFDLKNVPCILNLTLLNLYSCTQHADAQKGGYLTTYIPPGEDSHQTISGTCLWTASLQQISHSDQHSLWLLGTAIDHRLKPT